MIISTWPVLSQGQTMQNNASVQHTPQNYVKVLIGIEQDLSSENNSNNNYVVQFEGFRVKPLEADIMRKWTVMCCTILLYNTRFYVFLYYPIPV
jgi:hypothetical protein